MAIYGYARVSNADQDYARQEHALRAAGCKVIRAEAIDLLASRLRTLSQIDWHLTQAFEAGYQAGESPIGAGLVEAVLSWHLDDLESTLTRQGYGLKELVQNLEARPAEIKALFANQLDAIWASELQDRMRRTGLPI